jgi:predicted kinase
MTSSRLEEDIRQLSSSLSVFPETGEPPFMILISGLPGSGKSYLARKLAEKLPAIILQSDALRKALTGKPSYSPGESTRLFKAMHCLAGNLLAQGIPVIIDATNLTEKNRCCFYREADARGIKTVTVYTHAPEELVKTRLYKRQSCPEEKSDAGWEVYRKMAPGVQPPRREHFDLDTSENVESVIEQIVQEVKKPAKISGLLKGENGGNQR